MAGMTFILVSRGAVIDVSKSEGLVSELARPKEPFWSKASTRLSPTRSYTIPKPARMLLLPLPPNSAPSHPSE